MIGRIGKLGRLYVKNELYKRGNNIEQKGYFIYAKHTVKNNKNIDCVVKVSTSLFKSEGMHKIDKETYDKISTPLFKRSRSLYPNEVPYYGWTVKCENAKSKKFDYFVGVALDDDFTNPQFYIFTKEDISKIKDSCIPRFKNVQKKIQLYENNQSYEVIKNKYPESLTELDKELNENKSKFLERWNVIDEKS